MVYVTWYDALAYCQWLSQMSGRDITLPSEAEWEKAARGDKDKRSFSWGDTFEATCCNSRELGLGSTTPVGIFPEGASPYGCLDMAGNVREWTRSLWCKDCQKPDYRYPYDSTDGREGFEAPIDVLRVLRGGSWFDVENRVRCAARARRDPGHRGDNVGFRVVASPLRP